MKYFDYAATCPLDPEAAQAYIKASTEYFGNTRSLHDIGSTANDLLENCRKEFANLLHVEKEGIYFTSGGSESNFLGIRSLLSTGHKTGKHIISGIAEHSSIQSTLEKLKLEGYEITYLSFTKEGLIDLQELKKAIRDDTVLVSIQHGNPEIGTIQPIEDISSICKDHNILLNSDCVQTFGKCDLKAVAKVVDSLSFSGHKFYGPKGIGGVFVNPRLAIKSYYPGATHEKGFRPGTLNVPAIVAMTVAAQKAYRLLNEHTDHFKALRNHLISVLAPVKDQLVIYNLNDSLQLPSTLGLRIKGLEGQWVMLECNRVGIAISTGSACQTGLQSPSKTMAAIGVNDKEAKEFIRITFGWDTTMEDVELLGRTIRKIVMDYHSESF